MAGELLFGRVVELLDVVAAEATVDYEECLALVHEGDHHDDVFLGVGEFEWVF